MFSKYSISRSVTVIPNFVGVSLLRSRSTYIRSTRVPMVGA